MELHNEEFVSASKRASDRLRKAPIATAVRYDRRIGRVVFVLSSGIEVAFRPHDAQGLEKAKVADLDDIEISPSGLGIHLYLPALLEGFFGSRQWIAAQNGRAGGKATSPTKADAARQNGKLGGRPRKSPEPI